MPRRSGSPSGSFAVGDTVVNEGDLISIDGTTGTVVLGQVALTEAERPPELETVLGWADDIRAGRLGVRANADTGPDAANARSYGAEGIGLCRTEHMFLAEDRLPIVRRMILASSPDEEEAALEELRVAQREDFESILEAMDGLPVTVRLLDPPLHEFLPRRRGAGGQGSDRRADAEEQACTPRPARGTSSTRCSAPAACASGSSSRASTRCRCAPSWKRPCSESTVGGHPVVEIMIPLTVAREELALARSWVEAAVEEAEAAAGRARKAPASAPRSTKGKQSVPAASRFSSAR